jgi:hypothetical protein
VSTAQLVESVAFLLGIALLTWQFRWLLRAYRKERDQQASDARSSRAFLLALALVVFITLTSIAGLEGARRIAIGAVLLLGLADAAWRRWGKRSR